MKILHLLKNVPSARVTISWRLIWKSTLKGTSDSGSVFLQNEAHAWYGRYAALTLFADFEQ